MGKTLYGTLGGFKYCYSAKPTLGAYMAMDTFGRGLLRYGRFDEYHTFHEDSAVDALLAQKDEQPVPGDHRLRIKGLGELLEGSGQEYRNLHFEETQPSQELIFRSLLPNQKIPVTRRVYTISTIAHLRGLLNVFLLNNGCRPYDSIVAPSKATGEVIRRYLSDVEEATEGRFEYRGRVDVIPYGVDVKSLALGDKRAAKVSLGLPSDSVVILSVGRFSWSSKVNFDRLLILFSRILKLSDQKLVLALAGADPERESKKIEAIGKKLGIGEHLWLMTDFDPQEKQKIYDCADIYWALGDNLQESFGISLVEAMAFELPVVCTDWNGHKDIVVDGETGFRIPVAWKVRRRAEDCLLNFGNLYDHSAVFRISRDLGVDVEMLIAKTLDLIQSVDMRKKLGECGRLRAVEEFSMQAMIGSFEDLWGELRAISVKDRSEYKSLRPVLDYDYPRHFESYPTTLE